MTALAVTVSPCTAVAATTTTTTTATAQATPAAAGSAPQLAVQVDQASGPASSYFVVAGQPGASATAGSLSIENLSNAPATVALTPVAAQTLSTLGSTYGTSGQALAGPAAWLGLSASTLTLAPHAGASITVTVNVPGGATPGDYLSGIAVVGTNQPGGSPGSSAATVAQQYRYAVGVETQIAGARTPHIGFSGASVQREPSSIVFFLAAHNDGNVILAGVSGHVLITRGSTTVASQPIAAGTFVSGTQISMPVPTPGENPAPGTVYRVRAELDYTGGVATLDTLVTYKGTAGATSAGAKTTGGASTHAGAGTAGRTTTVSGHTHAATSTTTAPPPAPVHRHSRPHAHHHARRRAATGAHSGGVAAGSLGSGAGGTGATGAPTASAQGRHGTLADLIAALARTIVALTTHAAFPVLLIVVMVLFLLLQDRIDRRDPKLAFAPVQPDPKLDFS